MWSVFLSSNPVQCMPVTRFELLRFQIARAGFEISGDVGILANAWVQSSETEKGVIQKGPFHLKNLKSF